MCFIGEKLTAETQLALQKRERLMRAELLSELEFLSLFIQMRL
jgi:hypothetical protein